MTHSVRPVDANREERLGEALAACLEAEESGADPGAVAARYPEFAEELHRFFVTRQELDRLGEPSSALIGQVDRPGGGTAPPAEFLSAGHLGDFELLREVGRGGMGIVYEARQLSLRRRVALKVLPLAAALDARQLQRFTNEAQAAAQLHHNHIVPVYAVGCERGIHYYAMQFIDGHTLADLVRDLRGRRESGPGFPGAGTRSGDTLPPSLGARTTEGSVTGRAFFRRVAALGRQAAEALDYAHQQGIIHRDVKPANLLVDGHGDLWVTDFGLALFHQAAGPTVTGDLVGTLRYMSPEQALAKRGLVDHRTDVYSLGVTLYELLTLHPPFRGTDRQELLRQVAFDEPRPPRHVNRAVPLELETVVLKAMAKDPAERYATAQELAEDLQRFLEDRPVLARRPSPAQRLAKWSRRHKSLLAAAGVGLVVALAALAVSSVAGWRAYQTAEAARVAEAQNSLLAAGTLNEVFLELPDKQFPRAPGRKQDDVAVFRQGAAFYERWVRTVPDGPESLPVKAQAYARLAGIYDRLGQTGKAEADYCEAARLLEGMGAGARAPAAQRQELAAVLNNLGSVFEQRRRFQQAEATHRRAADLRQALASEFSDVPEYGQELAESLTNLSLVLAKTGRLDEAEQVLRQAVERREALAAGFPSESKYRGDLAGTRSHLALLLWERKRNAEAEALLLQSRTALAELVARSYHPIYTTQLIQTLHQLGLLRQSVGRSAEAASAYREAIALERRLTGEFGWIPKFRQELATSLQKLGEVLAALGQAKDAEAALREALDLAEQVAAENPDKPVGREVLAGGRVSLGQVLADTGRYREAEAGFRQAVADWQRLVAEVPDSPDHRKQQAVAHLELGRFLADRGRPRQAEACYREAADQWTRLVADFPRDPSYRKALSVVQCRRGQLLQAAGRLGEAETAVRQAVALVDQLAGEYPTFPPYRRARALAHGQWAALLADTPRHRETEAAFWEAAALAAKLVQGAPGVVTYRDDLAAVQDQWGRWLMSRGRAVEAEPHFREAVNLLNQLLAKPPAPAGCARKLAWLLATCPHPCVRDPLRAVALARQAAEREPQDTSSWSVLGVAYARSGDWPAARTALQKAIALPGGGDATDHLWLALAHARLGRPDLARRSYEAGTAWMDANRPGDRDLGLLRAEAEGRLGQATFNGPPARPRRAGRQEEQ